MKTNEKVSPKAEENSTAKKHKQEKRENKFNKFITQHKIASIVTLIMAVIIALIVTIILVVNSFTIDLAAHVKVEFEGYNKIGRLKFNSKEVKEQAEIAAFKMAGFDENLAKQFAGDGISSLPSIFQSPENLRKFARAGQLLRNFEYGFDKMDKLSNGDKVKFWVRLKNTEAPVRETTREFTVSGLKDIREITLKTSLEESPIEFDGYDGFGSLKKSDKYLPVENSKNFSNGDKVKVKWNSNYILKNRESGLMISDEDAVEEVEVSGLKKLTEIENISSVIDRSQDLAKSENKDSDFTYFKATHKIEKQKDFIKYSKFGGKNNFSAVSVYKITTTSITKAINVKEETTTKYKIYGYDNLEILDNRVILSDLSGKGTSHRYTSYTDAESAFAVLRANDFVEYRK